MVLSANEASLAQMNEVDLQRHNDVALAAGWISMVLRPQKQYRGELRLLRIVLIPPFVGSLFDWFLPPLLRS
jgi:hypothetical protein